MSAGPVVLNALEEQAWLAAGALGINAGGNGASAQSGADDSNGVTIPDELAILPLRGLVVYPLTAAPLAVGQSRSIRLVDEAVASQRLIGLFAVHTENEQTSEPGADDVFSVGTLAAIQRLFRAPDGSIRLLVTGVMRIRIESFSASEPYLKAHVTPLPETLVDGVEAEALTRHLLEQFRRVAELGQGIPAELVAAAVNAADARQLAYTIASYLRMTTAEAQALLELDGVADKMRRLIALLSKELEVLELGKKIQNEAQSEMEHMQREFFLREQLKAIQRELGEKDEQAVEIDTFRQKLAENGLPEEAAREAERELGRLAKLPSSAAEYGVIRTYLEWLIAMPWNRLSTDDLDLIHARTVLDEDHYGLADVKTRILEYLAVRKLRGLRHAEAEASGEAEPAYDHIRRQREGVILCFVGPPGVGKTSLGQSIARALGRKFVRQALGGIHDEAEVRGFRRTYIGAMPGRIAQALRRVETRNPVFMLDEVDKLGRDFRGDPAAALLEVLDPEQNREFRDHYLDVPFDLSQVMFICTANQLDTVPGPLLDRMEILQLSGYTDQEKLRIAHQYLVPRQILENGLRAGDVTFTDAGLVRLVREYTREAGVRGLEREIGRVCRKQAMRHAADEAPGPLVVDAEAVPGLLDKQRFYDEVAERTETPGVATGLVVTAVGGDIVFIEATQMRGSKGFLLTGQLGEVMQESAQAAFSYVRANAATWGLADDHFEKHDIHVHVPAGAVPKDGPSAGVTMATALVSLFTGRPVRNDVAMTGEITLRGQVLPIGGLKEKVLAAHRTGITTVILPKRNAPDLADVPEEIRASMTFVSAERVEQVITAALAPSKPTAEGSNLAEDSHR